MKQRHSSILRVVGWRLLLVSVIFLALIVGLLQTKVETAVEGLFHQALEEEARSVAARLTVGADGKLAFLPLESPAGSDSVIRYRVLDTAGKTLFSSPDLPTDLPSRAGLEPDETSGRIVAGALGQMSFFELAPPLTGDHEMGATLATSIAGRPILIQVFEDIDARGVIMDDLVHSFFTRVGWLLIPFVILLFLVNIMTIWAELQPLRRVSRMASEIGPESIGRRLPEDGQPREILPLIRSVNRVLERLDRGFKVQRQFTADAAHELRTPLAVLNAHLDTLSGSHPVAALRQEVAGMSRLVAQLLRIAQLDALTKPPSDQLDLRNLAVDAASALVPLALKQGKSIAVVGEENPVMVRGDPEALTHAIRNLIENALAYTPKGTTVEIELNADGSVRVSDSGPGVPAEYRDQIFRRFWRADRRRDGAGLGLAIVAKVAETHGARVYVEDAPGGGASFVLKLARLADSPAPSTPSPSPAETMKERTAS